MVEALGERYFEVDTRVLGMFRIGLGLVLLVDVLRRVPHAEMFYSERGVLPGALAMEHPWGPWGDPVFSLFFYLQTPTAAIAGMLALAAVYLCYTVGYRTRWMQLIALVGYASLNARNVFVENRGHVEISLALVWTLLLPLGERYSVDALRGRSEGRTKVRSLAIFGITLQIAAIYILNAVQKEGAPWEQGQAVHYVLWQNRVATELAGWLRLHEPSFFSPLFTRATILVEGLAAILVLSPFRQRLARSAFLVLALGLHSGIALLMNLWPHSYTIMVFNLLMLPRATLDRVLRVGWIRKAGVSARRKVERWRKRGDPSRGWFRGVAPHHRFVARESLVMILLVAIVVRVTQSNPAVPEALRCEECHGYDALISYGRLYQRWSMFAEAPIEDGTIVVDATSASGEHVDPLTGGPPDFDAPFHGPWGYTEMHCDYYLDIQRGNAVVYRSALLDYLEHVLRADYGDMGPFESIEVYWVGNRAPPPGATKPRMCGGGSWRAGSFEAWSPSRLSCGVVPSRVSCPGCGS